MLLLVWLAGCRTVTPWTECAKYSYDIDDQDQAADLPVTPDEVLGAIVGPFVFAAAYDDGTPVTGQGEVVRGAGPAVVTDGTLVHGESARGFGFRRTILFTSYYVDCRDTLEVPVDVAFRTDDGLVDFSFDGTASPVSRRASGEPDLFEVRGAVDAPDALAVPPPPDPAMWPELAVQWPAAGGAPWVSLWWEGGDYVQILESVAR